MVQRNKCPSDFQESGKSHQTAGARRVQQPPLALSRAVGTKELQLALLGVPPTTAHQA